MKTFRLYRDKVTPLGDGLLGYIVDADGITVAYTYELPYKANKPFVSCIPSGIYTCRLKYSASKGRCFEVCDVDGRSDILIHIGNTHADTEGCILVGQARNESAVLRSRIALGDLLIYMPDSFKLVIIDDY